MENYPERIWVERNPETNEKRWFSIKGMGVEYVRAGVQVKAPNVDEPPAMALLRGALSKRATSAEFNEWQARDVVEYVDRIRSAMIAPPAADNSST